MITKLIEPENSPNVMNKKVCPDFVRVLFVCTQRDMLRNRLRRRPVLAIFVAVFGFPVWVAELFEKRMEARRKIEW